MTQGQAVWFRTAARRPGTANRRARRAFAFTWTVCSALGAEIGCLVLDGAPLPFAVGLITLAGAQGYIVRERAGLHGAASRATCVWLSPRRPAAGRNPMSRQNPD